MIWRMGACMALAWLWHATPSHGQIPPLPSNPPRFRKPPKKRQHPGRFETPLARATLAWGKAFRKQLPKGWEMQWGASRLRRLGWMANHQPGFRIRFVHRKRKVVVPVPYPTFGAKDKNVKVIPLRCSLHFYPRAGIYRAHRSQLARLPPAALVAVTSRAIVLQANRFRAMEYPCPKLLKRFRKHEKVKGKGQPIRAPWGGKSKPAWLRKATLFPHHVELVTTGAKASRAALKRGWKALLRRTKRRTLVVRTHTSQFKKIAIYNGKSTGKK